MYRARRLGVGLAVLATAFASALPAFADPPPGHGNGNVTNVPPGQAKKTATPVPPVASATPTPSVTPSHVPPGQAKRTVHDPPGNNGTIKIHSVAGDLGHHNVPHVSCSSFFVDFWGFDAGQTLDVSFVGQAPTGKGVPVTFTAPNGTSMTSPDPAGGGNDFDGELPFIATPSALAVLGPPAHNGYHLRALVATHQGGGMKQKVFWIAPCVTAPSTPSAATPTPTSTPVLHVATRTLVGDTPMQLRHLPHHAPTNVVQEASLVPGLPFTGANIAALVIAGLAAIGLGTLLTVSARRRRRTIG